MNEINKINTNVFGEENINNYTNPNNAIKLINIWLENMNFDQGTICKYYRKLYSYLRSNEYMNIESLKYYEDHLKKLESNYRINRHNNNNNNFNHQLFSEIKNNINNGINKTNHQSIKIIGKFYLLIDYNQSLMFKINLSDFEKTTIDKSYGEKYYLDLENKIWNLDNNIIHLNDEFIQYIKQQHGKKTATNYKYLVGKINTFEKYSKSTGTSTFSKLFNETFKIEYNSFIKILKQSKNIYDQNIKEKEEEIEEIEEIEIKEEIEEIEIEKEEKIKIPKKFKLKLNYINDY
jgi:hypothetical protein